MVERSLVDRQFGNAVSTVGNREMSRDIDEKVNAKERTENSVGSFVNNNNIIIIIIIVRTEKVPKTKRETE